MPTKLDMGRAWSDAVALISGNRDVVLVIAGVFFLLPNLVLTLLFPEAAQPPEMPQGAAPDMERAMAELSAWFGEVWWMYAIIAVVQAVGSLALLTLLTDRARPTVGDAIGFGLRSLPTYLATQIIISFAFGIAGGVAIVLTQALPIAGLLVGLFVIVFGLYAMLKLSLVTPVIAIDKVMSPVAAMQRSWQLTKGNSLLIFAFFLLLIIAFLVVSLVAGLLFAAFGLLGEEIGMIVGAIGNGLVSMALVVVMLPALAAVHRQLSGGSEAGSAFD